MMLKQPVRRAALAVALLGVLLGVTLLPAANAQPPAPEPIALGENRLGQVTDTNITPTFAFMASAGQTVSVEVLAIDAGFTPQLTLLTPERNLVQAIGNPAQSNRIQAEVTFPAAGTYLLQVINTNSNLGGQFLLTISGQDTAPPPTPLTVPATEVGELAPGSQARYSFSATGEVLELSIESLGDSGSQVDLLNAQDEVIATLGSSLLGGTFLIPPGDATYRLVLRGDVQANAPIPYEVRLNIQTPPGEPGIAARPNPATRR
ncbi:MAG: hypothetical protein HC915_07160 [Anaerolineae bacterium]|nr:hypothetical protein [Anaerolineae bacterium]